MIDSSQVISGTSERSSAIAREIASASAAMGSTASTTTTRGSPSVGCTVKVVPLSDRLPQMSGKSIQPSVPYSRADWVSSEMIDVCTEATKPPKVMSAFAQRSTS